MNSSKKNIAMAIIAVLLVVSVGAGIGMYVHQNQQVSDLTNKVNALKGDNAAATKKLASLSTQLNNANQALSAKTAQSTFVSGATCQTQQLALAAEKSLGGAAGSTGELFSYQNISDSTCTVQGYPGFLALDNAGHVMPNGPVDTANAGSATSPQLLTLAPSAKAYFLAHWPAHDAEGNQTGCITPSLLESTPPTNLLPLTIATSLAQICGTPTVSALGQANDFE